jgi:N-acetylglucosamine transport system permease protein
LRRFGSARWRKRNLTFDKITFFLVFLVIPVAFYIAFVVSPFVQAAYFLLTDWTGFTPAMNFIGLSLRGCCRQHLPKPWATTFSWRS